MHARFSGFFVAAILYSSVAAAPARSADDYAVDPAHSGVNFKISHLNLAWIHGRFNDFAGTFTIDPDDPAKSSFAMTIKPESVDTNNQKRDDQLRSPDFFNVKQFPVLSFKSTAVKAIKDGYEVSGDFTLHGVTKPITLTLVGGRHVEFPKGVQRTGFSTDLTIKRSDFGMDKFTQALGDDVQIAVSFEGAKK